MSAKDKLKKRAEGMKKELVSEISANRPSGIDQRYTAGGISSIDINLIFENEKNIRQIDDETLNSLIESIKETGLQQNLVVSKIGNNQYKLLSGHRRFRALKKLHEQFPKDHRFDLIPCLVVSVEADPEHDISAELTERMLIATTNVEIESLTKKELLESILICEEYYNKKYKGEKKKKTAVKEDISNKTGLSQKYIYDLLKFNTNLIPEFYALFFEKENITHRTARILADLDQETQIKIYQHFNHFDSEVSGKEINQYLSDMEISSEDQDKKDAFTTASELSVDPNESMIQNGSINDQKNEEAAASIEKKTYLYDNLKDPYEKKVRMSEGKREFILPNELPKRMKLEIDVCEDMNQLQPVIIKSAKGVFTKTSYRKYVNALNQISKQFCLIADLIDNDFN